MCVRVCVCARVRECMSVGVHVCSGWYLLWVALAVSTDGRRRGVVVEDRTGEVVDHQHLPLQWILDQKRNAVQPLALLEHIPHVHTHTHTDTYTQDAGGQTSIARRRKHVHMRDMRGQRTRRETHTPLLRVKICQCAHAGMLWYFLMYSHSHICHARTRTFHTATAFTSVIPQNEKKQNTTHLREFCYVRDRSQINQNKSLSRTLSAFRAKHCSHLAKGSSVTWMRTLISQVTHNFTIKALSTENGAITFDVSPQLGCSIPCWNNLRFKRLLLCSGYY